MLLPTMGSGTGLYGAMKVASEALCFAYNQALGIEFATIRPSAVYGLGMNHFPGPIKATGGGGGARRADALRNGWRAPA